MKMIRCDSTHKIKKRTSRKAASNNRLQNFSLHNRNLRRSEKIISANLAYNNLPIIDHNSRPIPVYLLYNGHKILVKSYFGMPYKQLVQILYKQIINLYVKKGNFKSKESIQRNIMSILGFSTVCKNLKIDYLISIMHGQVQKSLLLECFFKRKRKIDSKKVCLKKVNNQFDDFNNQTQPTGNDFQINYSENKFNYQICNCLAIGGFSKVYLARSYQDGRFYAIKFIKKKKEKDEFNRQGVINEMKICAQLNHPYIVKMKQAFETTKFYCMVFQYCPGGQLFFLLKKIKTMSQQSARIYFIQILLGIKYVHQKNILYRDLKPENILIDWQGNLKIVDFGLSKKSQSIKKKTYSYCGSAQYMAPQMILRSGHNSSVDYYSLGALLFQLVTGLPPFYSKNHQQLQQSIITQELCFPQHIPLSSQIKDLLTHLLAKDQKYRLGSYAGIKQIIFHPWIGKFNIQEYLKKHNFNIPYPPDLSLHNFDQDQLGEDEEEFSNEIYNQFQFSGKCSENNFWIKGDYKQEPIYQQIINKVVKQIPQIKTSSETQCVNTFYNNQKIYKIYNCHRIKKSNYKHKSLNKSLNCSQNEGYHRKSNQNLSNNKPTTVFVAKSALKSQTLKSNQANFNSAKKQLLKQNRCPLSVIKKRQMPIKTYHKLLPYFTKNKSSKNSQNQIKKLLPKTNILKLKQSNNLQQQSQENNK